jgi:hypothetical protein
MKKILLKLAVLASIVLAVAAGCSNPANTAPDGQKEILQGTVAITGTAKVGETLTADITGITNGTGTASYQWRRAGAAISGATGSTYTAVTADAGNAITVTVTFSGNSGSLTSTSTGAVQPEDTPPTLEHFDTIDLAGEDEIVIEVYKNSSNAITGVIVTLPDGSTVEGTAISGTQSTGYTITTETGDVTITTAGNTVTVTMQDSSSTTYNIDDEQPTLEPYDTIDLAGPTDEIVIEVYKNSSDAIVGVVVTLPGADGTIEGTAISGSQSAGYSITTTAGLVTIAILNKAVTVATPDSTVYNYTLPPDTRTIPQYTVYSKDTVTDISFADYDDMPGVGSGSTAGGIAKNTMRGRYAMMLSKMQAQSINLKNGYTAVSGEYPGVPGLSGLQDTINNTIKNTTHVKNYPNANLNSNIDSVLGNGNIFGNDLAAYRAGQYYKQTYYYKPSALTSFESALAGVTGINKNNPSDRVDDILADLYDRMLANINTAMTTGGSITNTEDISVIHNLNENLIKQMEDLEQFRAVITDICVQLEWPDDLVGGGGYNFQDWLNSVGGNEFLNTSTQVMQSQPKAAHLANANTFDAELLKSQPYIKDEKTGIAIA